jgi:hypothetical protein
VAGGSGREGEGEGGTRGAGGGGFGGGKRCHQRGDGEQGTRSPCGGCLVDDRGRMLPRLLRMVRSVPSKTNRRPGFLSSPFAYRRHHSRKSRAIRKKKKAKVKSINSICLWACILVSNDYETSNTPNCMQGAFLWLARVWSLRMRESYDSYFLDIKIVSMLFGFSVYTKFLLINVVFFIFFLQASGAN